MRLAEWLPFWIGDSMSQYTSNSESIFVKGTMSHLQAKQKMKELTSTCIYIHTIMHVYTRDINQINKARKSRI